MGKKRTAIHIGLTRVAADPLAVERKGEALIFNGAVPDLSGVTAKRPLALEDAGCPWLASDVTRDRAGLHLVLIAPCSGGDLPEALWTPAPLHLTGDGPVDLPAWDAGIPADRAG